MNKHGLQKLIKECLTEVCEEQQIPLREEEENWNFKSDIPITDITIINNKIDENNHYIAVWPATVHWIADFDVRNYGIKGISPSVRLVSLKLGVESDDGEEDMSKRQTIEFLGNQVKIIYSSSESTDRSPGLSPVSLSIDLAKKTCEIDFYINDI